MFLLQQRPVHFVRQFELPNIVIGEGRGVVVLGAIKKYTALPIQF